MWGGIKDTFQMSGISVLSGIDPLIGVKNKLNYQLLTT